VNTKTIAIRAKGRALPRVRRRLEGRRREE